MILCSDSLKCHFIQHRVFLGGISKAPSEGELGGAGIPPWTMKGQVALEGISGHHWPPWFVSWQGITLFASLSFNFLVRWGKRKHPKIFFSHCGYTLRADTKTLPIKDDSLLWMAAGEGENKAKLWDPPVPASQAVCLALCSFYIFLILSSLFKMQARWHVA